MFTTKAIMSALEKAKEMTLSPEALHKLEDQLDIEYRFSELPHQALVDFSRIDFVVCLSGRGDFEGKNADIRVQKFLQHKEIDAKDTLVRFFTAVQLASKVRAVRNKNVPIYFSGIDYQSNQLRNILKKDGQIFGFPAELIIVDDLPFPSTLGQVLALNYFFYQLKDKEASPENIVIVSSRYHLPRVMRAFGSDSPLLTHNFYQSNPELYSKTPDPVKDAMTDNNFFDALKRKRLDIVGAGANILQNPNGENDLFSDMQATVNYSLVQSPFSIAKAIPGNVQTFMRALSRWSLWQFVHAPQHKESHEKNELLTDSHSTKRAG